MFFVAATAFIRRSCANSRTQANLECTLSANLKENCEICDYDGCNRGLQFGPTTLLIISIPIVIVKLFSL